VIDRPDRPISLRLPGALLDEIGRRHKPAGAGEREHRRSHAIRVALSRYYEICRRHAERLRLTAGELNIVVELLAAGRNDDDLDVGQLLAEFVLSCPGICQVEGLTDEQALDLARRLQIAPYADIVALLDLAEIYLARRLPSE
jgi:hypothetical protein